MQKESSLLIGDENLTNLDLSDEQIDQVIKTEFNLEARRRIEHMLEEKALKKLLDDDYF